MNHDLTPREREVLALLERGYTNQRIAAELTISCETVKSHVSHILMKMNVPNRQHLRKLNWDGHGHYG